MHRGGLIAQPSTGGSVHLSNSPCQGTDFALEDGMESPIQHNFETQRRETFDTFRQSKGVSLPKTSVVDYLFFIEELDASWPALERALRLEGFQTRRAKDGETLIASIGPIPVTAEDIWNYERIATSIALKHDFYPDGWELAE